MSTSKYSALILGAGIMIFIFWQLVRNINNIQNPDLWDGVISASIFILWGCTGILWAVRKEIPPKDLYPINENVAIIIGGITAIGFWGYGLFLLIRAIFASQ